MLHLITQFAIMLYCIFLILVIFTTKGWVKIPFIEKLQIWLSGNKIPANTIALGIAAILLVIYFLT